MRREDNQMKNRGERGRMEISNSRAMGVIVLIALLFVFQVATFVLQKIRGASADGIEENAGSAPQRFRFNPNTITLDSLQLLGFSQRQAQTILNYRSKGGTFRRREDFARMYTVDSAMYASLEEYIFIPDKDTSLLRNFPVRKRGVSGTKSAFVGKMVQERDDIGAKRYTGESVVYGEKVEGNRYVCNLNTADSAALVELYGIGGHFARKILEYRERLGGSFAHKRQLLEIEGFSQQRYEQIENNIVVNENDVKGFSLLDADRKALERHPYIGPYAARGIITYLRIKGREAFSDELKFLEELVKEHIITENNARRLVEYLLHL